MLAIENIDSFFGIGSNSPMAMPVSHEFIWCASRKSHKLTPVLHAHTHAINDDPICVASVSSLLSRKSPSAVTWLIISIVIYSINRMSRGRSASHIRKEILKAISPPFANLNSSSSPFLVTGIIRIVTPQFHFCPNFIFRTLTEIVRSLIGISRQQVSGSFFCEASAAKCRFPDIASGRDGELTAITATSPHRVASTDYVFTPYNKQSTKSFSFEIKRWGQDRNLLVVDSLEQYRKMG